MNGQMDGPSTVHTEEQAPQTDLQIHPQLQTEGQPGVQVQPSLPVEVLPILHPSLQSQPQVVAEAQPQPEPMQSESQIQVETQVTEMSPSAAVPITLPVLEAPVARVPPVVVGTTPPTMVSSQPVPSNDLATIPIVDPGLTTDGISELQDRAKLAASRVRLMDATIDVLITTFKNRYALDKALEKRCAKLLKAAAFETSDRELKEDLRILAESTQWVKENLKYLDHCLHEKHRNVQIAGPLVDAKSERKKEEKQADTIHKFAGKIGQRAMKREEKDMKKGAQACQVKMVEDAWKQLPSASGQ